MSSRHVVACSAVIAITVAVGFGQMRTAVAAHGAASATIPPCNLRLPPPSLGSPRFAIPDGGRAVARRLAGRFRLCTLLRADGSRFAETRIDRLGQLLEIRFFRTNGRLRFASDAAYPAKASTEGAEVSCGNNSTNSIGPHYWRENIKWWVGKTPSGFARDHVVDALRAAQSEWANNVNWCGADDNSKGSAQYEGGSSSLKAGHDGKNVVDWGKLDDVQNCDGALACTATWYDEDGKPLESDVRFNNEIAWSLNPDADSYDIQSVAAHEFGHMRQFDHVTTGEPSVLMWPYYPSGETSGRKLGKGDSRGNNANY